MKFEVKHEITLDVAAVSAAARAHIDAALEQGVDLIVTDAKALVHPFRRSGQGEDSIGGEVKDGTAWVWAKKFYMRWYEYGSRHQRARPFLRPAIIGARARIVALLTQAVQGAWAGENLIRDVKRRPTASAAPPAAVAKARNAHDARPDKSLQPKRPRTREEWKAYGHWKKHRFDQGGGVNATGRSTRPRN